MGREAAHLLSGVIQVAPGLTDPVLIAAPRGICCCGDPLANAVRGHLHRRMTSHALQAPVNRAYPLDHVGQGRAIVGNDNVCAFGGKVLQPASLEKMTQPFKSNYALGLTVETVSRVFSRMQKLDFLRVDNKEIEILDMQGVRNMANVAG